jgi:3-dehydroquinate synthase
MSSSPETQRNETGTPAGSPPPRDEAPAVKAAPPAVSETLRQRISVPFEYPVVFTRGAFDPDNRALVDVLAEADPRRRHRVLAVVDAGFAAAYPEVRAQLPQYFARHAQHLQLVADPHELPGGEACKNDPAVIDRLHTLFHHHRMDRHSYVLIAGGGAVLDAAGYAAATTHRGLRTVRVPTTVLSQNDSGVGVKNGINAFQAKNFLGTFVPPNAVICDVNFLDRLPRRDAVAGLAEAVKVSLIRDPDFFQWIEGNARALATQDLEALARLIRRCAELHLQHIATSGDPFEHGSARPLDFGHWAAHKLEALTHNEVRHGEAVAMGILLDSRYAFETGMLGAAEFDRIHRTLGALGLPLWHDQLLAAGRSVGRPALLDGLEDFREHLGGELTVTLIRGVGRGVEVHQMDHPTILKALDWMRAHRPESPGA